MARQLAIAVGTGSALAEAVVALRIDRTAGGDLFEVVAPGRHRLAAIKHDAADAMARELISTEEPRRTVTHHHHAVARGAFAQRRPTDCGFLSAGAKPQQESKADATVTSINAPLEQPHSPHHGPIDPELARDAGL